MPSTTLSGRRIVDPVLTSIAQQYENQDYVGDLLFPPCPVDLREGNLIVFSDDLQKDTFTERAPGAERASERFGYDGKSYKLKQFSRSAQVTREEMEEAKNAHQINIAADSVEILIEKAKLSTERRQAEAALKTSNYATSNKDSAPTKWDVSGTNPIMAVREARNQIRSQIGMYPNVMVISAAVFEALVENPQIVDRIKHTSQDSVTPAMIAKLFMLDYLAIGGAIKRKADGSTSDLWAKSAVLAKVATPKMMSSQQAMGSNSRKKFSFGYTYTLRGYPMVEQAQWFANRSAWEYPVTVENTPNVLHTGAGFLFKNLIS